MLIFCTAETRNRQNSRRETIRSICKAFGTKLTSQPPPPPPHHQSDSANYIPEFYIQRLANVFQTMNSGMEDNNLVTFLGA